MRRVSIPEYTLGGTDRKRPAHKSNLDPVLLAEGERETEKKSAATPDSSARNKSKDGPKTKRATAPRVHFVSSSHLIPLRLCSQPLPHVRSFLREKVHRSFRPFRRSRGGNLAHHVPMHPETRFHRFFVSNSSVENESECVGVRSRLSVSCLASLYLSRLLVLPVLGLDQVRPDPRRI